MKIKERFYGLYKQNCNCTFDNFGVDIEFKVDSQVSPRKIYIKQPGKQFIHHSYTVGLKWDAAACARKSRVLLGKAAFCLKKQCAA